MRKLITAIIMAAILYLLIQEKYKNGQLPDIFKKETDEQSLELDKKKDHEQKNFQGNFLEKTLSSVLYNMLHTQRGRDIIENMIKPYASENGGLNNGYDTQNLNVEDSIFSLRTYGAKTKNAERATCGHLVTADYTIMTKDNLIIDSNKNKNWTLGDSSVIDGLNSAVIGMSQNQTRAALIPAKYAYANGRKPKLKNFDISQDVKLEVSLKHILPKLFIMPEDVKIFDKNIMFEAPMLCGDEAVFHAKIKDLSNGKVVFDSKNTPSKKEIKMRIGNQNYPLIFSHALHGKHKASDRIVIAQGKYFVGLARSKTLIFPDKQLEKEKYFMLELSNKT